MRKRILQIILGLLLIDALLLLAGFVYQQQAVAQEQKRFPAPGQMVDVGGHQLHIHCLGEGDVTIIVDTGAADWSLSWQHLHANLAQQTRTCIYDRAGLGWSEAGPMPRTSETLVAELHTLLTNAEIEPPYILLGHSLGGYNARVFQDRYPEEVAGIILVDAAHPDQWERLPSETMDLVDQQVGLLETMVPLSKFGIVRFLLPTNEQLSKERQIINKAHFARDHHLATAASEFGNGVISAQQAAATAELDDLPLVVITAGRSFDAFRPLVDEFPFEEADQTWLELQAELASLSTNSVHLVSETADHNINFTDPAMILTGVAEMMQMLEQ